MFNFGGSLAQKFLNSKDLIPSDVLYDWMRLPPAESD